MNYRSENKLVGTPSLLGFGCMRYPVRNEDLADVIEEEAKALVDEAIRQGINYFDMGYAYHGGRCEEVTARLLADYPRDSYLLADKLPIWLIKSPEDTEKYFMEQLERCGTDYFDYYLIHSVDRNKYKIAENNGVCEKLQEFKAKGLIRNLGFSYHDDPAHLKPILDAHKWDFVQIELNYLDWTLQDAKGQYNLLAEYNIPCMVMEPTRGGVLANLPEACAAPLLAVHPERSQASWAIQFVASMPNVVCLLSGMTTVDIIRENAATVSNPAPFNEEEQKAIDQVMEIYRSTQLIPCTGCGYCSECPKKISIPKIFNGYNQYLAGGKDRFQFYNVYFKLNQEEKAKNCIKCGICMEHCPQQIKITDELTMIQEMVDDINANRPSTWFEI